METGIQAVRWAPACKERGVADTEFNYVGKDKTSPGEPPITLKGCHSHNATFNADAAVND